MRRGWKKKGTTQTIVQEEDRDESKTKKKTKRRRWDSRIADAPNACCDDLSLNKNQTAVYTSGGGAVRVHIVGLIWRSNGLMWRHRNLWNAALFRAFQQLLSYCLQPIKKLCLHFHPGVVWLMCTCSISPYCLQWGESTAATVRWCQAGWISMGLTLSAWSDRNPSLRYL